VSIDHRDSRTRWCDWHSRADRRAPGWQPKRFYPVDPDQVPRIIALYATGETPAAIARIVGVKPDKPGRVLRAHGIPIRTALDTFRLRYPNGRLHPVNADGYRLRTVVDGDGPVVAGMGALSHGREAGYRTMMEHQYVMAHKLGRPLLPGETVHHKDGNRANNAAENLELRQGNHGSGWIVACLDCGGQDVPKRMTYGEWQPGLMQICADCGSHHVGDVAIAVSRRHAA
jgi:hypothetical protein